jgi:hypothetical protein
LMYVVVIWDGEWIMEVSPCNWDVRAVDYISAKTKPDQGTEAQPLHPIP